jgi:hypothetical protein
MDYLLISPGFIGRGMDQAARIGFQGRRYGMMNWLGEPAPMRGIGFFSNETHFFVSAILNDPSEALIHYMLYLKQSGRSQEYAQLSKFVAENGDLLKALGGEVSIGVENPILPVPNLKIVLEVADRPAFEAALGRMLEGLRGEWDAQARASLLQQTPYKDYMIQSLNVDGWFITPSWAFVGDYLVLGPGPQFVRHSIDVFKSGQSIAQDRHLLSLIPGNARPNFSVLVYQDIAKALPELVRTKITPKLNPDTAQAMPNLALLERLRAPGIAYACSYPTRIDLFFNAPKGLDFNMGLAMPAVANWLGPKMNVGYTAKKVAEAQLGLEEMRKGIERFRQEKGRLPRNLSELASPSGRYIERIPEDPFGLAPGDALRLIEGPGRGQVTIYSIGPDGVDDQGKVPDVFEKEVEGKGDVVVTVQ